MKSIINNTITSFCILLSSLYGVQESKSATLAEIVPYHSTNTIGRYNGGIFTSDGSAELYAIEYSGFQGFMHTGGVVGRLIPNPDFPEQFDIIDPNFTPITIDLLGKLSSTLNLEANTNYYYLFDSGELQELSLNSGGAVIDAFTVLEDNTDEGYINLLFPISLHTNDGSQQFGFQFPDSFGAVRFEGVSVPEPSSSCLILISLLTLTCIRRRKQKQ